MALAFQECPVSDQWWWWWQPKLLTGLPAGLGLPAGQSIPWLKVDTAQEREHQTHCARLWPEALGTAH